VTVACVARVPRRSPHRAALARPVRVIGLALVGILLGRTAGADLLTDPRFEVGAKRRLSQFIGRGADQKEAEAIFHRLNDLDPERWVAEWTRLAEPFERYFEIVMVMHEHEPTRRNRLGFLSMFYQQFRKIADFSEIVTENKSS